MVCGAMELVRSYKAEPYFDDSWFTKSILLHAFVNNNFTAFMSHPVSGYYYEYFKINFLSFVYF